nr:gliding motility-associated C-terminal domain-containing protein [uncultured Draconibacterium sp.]
MKKNLPKLFEILSIFNESKIMWFKTLLIAVILAMSGNVYSQVIVPFNPRTSSYTPNQTIYHVKGDFTMLGNTNLILKDYSATKNNNNNDVIFVDIDNDPSTVNSSSATLVLSEENGATPECSNIIYAGLYWSGRTQRNDYENTWTTGGSTENVYNNNVINNAYTLNISQNGSWSNDNNRTATYTFTPSGGGDVVTFEFTTNYHSKEVKVSVGGGPATTINASYSSDWNNMTANFDTPYIINTGSANIKVNNLRKNTSSNTIDESFRANVTYGGVTLNKQEVLFKATGDTYSTVSATNSNILYPQGDDYDQIYVAYAEVTDYVRQNGTAEYTVANIALREGQDDAGRSGGWGLVVVYENSKMKWRDVSIFDGYGYMKSSGNDAYLPVQGFNTVPSGDVNMKLGMMASEGDISAAGDFFAIQKLQSSDYERLNHSENSTDNFFNSSIYTGNNPRNPNITNNIGMDISMFNIPNADKSIIANGQTSTTFKYGTNGDGYVIYSIAMAVDAYVPEPEATVAIESVNSTPPGTEVLPNDIIEYNLEIRNIGTEDIENGKIIIPIPYTAEYVSSSGAFFQGLNGNQPYYDSGEGATGAIIWEFGDMPLYNPTTTLLGKLTFKLKVTTDCFILSNANCSPAVTLDGSISGIGHDSQVAVSNVGFIQGYQTSGSCEGAAIKDPLTMPINAGTYVSENCSGDYSTRDFSYCNFGGSNIPFSDVTANFPAGTRFYNEYPVTSSATEYTNATGFPGTVGKTYYYAVPPGITACYWQFTITVNDITSTPNANNINYCIGDVATPLTATPSDNSYTLFYYTSATDDTPETSITPSTTEAGTTSYWVAEGLSNQCISPNKVKFEVKVNPLPEPYISGSSSVCLNTTMVYSTTLVAGNTYLWEVSNGTIIGSITNSTVNILWETEGHGSVSVTETTPSSCSKTKTLETDINEVDATEVTADHKDVTCYDGNDGAFTASASGGDGNYTYSLKNDFSNSNANGKFTGLTAGTYTVYVKDGNDCTDPTQLKVTITEPDEVDATEVTADHKDVTCYDGKDGAFTASASGGDGNYTYSLKNDFSNSNANGKFTGLTAGTYTVYVKDGNDCTDPTQLKVTITEPDEVDATEVTADHKDVTCYDGKDGAFTASASGGDGNYTYSLKNDFSNSNANGKFTGLTAGTYTVYVKDGNDCTDPTQLKVTITEPDEVDATEVTADHKDVTCYDGNDGAFTASASGGDGNYTYSLKNDFSNSNANGKFTGLTAGTYTVYVKDGNDCTDPTQLKVTITEPDEVDATEVTADHKDVTCYDGNDGAFTASASGGDGNYTYSLKNDFSNSNANGKFTGLTAGTYTVYVKDGNDCTDPTQLKVTITEPDEVDATEVTADHKDVTCYDGNDGAFTASASGGDGNYTYSLKNDFSNSNANGKFTGLTAGTYTVYVKDGNDCTDPTQLKVTITEPDEVDATEVTADHKDVTCYDGNDGAFTASASGGDGNYTYSLKNDFSNSNANGKFTGLTAGTYTVYVKDGNDCTDPTQLKVTITEPDEVDATEVTADHKDVTCYDGNDGAFTASASGGDGNYTYSLKNDFSNSNTNGKFTGLTAGTYTVYVKDGNDCTDPTQLKVTITEPKKVDATEVTADHKDVTCYDGNDGAFTASASGGDGNYTYSLKNDFSNSNTNGKFTGLTAGTYTVYVKDGNDCTDPTQLKVTINEPKEVDATEVTADHKDVTCYDGNDGAFTASASGGDGNYTYSLAADFSNSNTNGKFTGLTAGTYTVYVKDGNDCTDPTQLKVTITEPKKVDATEVTADHKDVTCYDGNDGAFTASASGGDGNYTYSLKNDFSNSNTNGKFTGLTAGTYTVYVKDGNDCTDPTQLKVTITEPKEVDATEVTADHKDVTCYDGNDGAFTASASGGDGNYTYSLKNDFSNSNTNGKFTGLTAGTYTVYVKDGNDCTDPTQLKVTINEPKKVDATEVTADHKDVTCYDGNDGAFTASASGGDGNYTYSLKNDFSNSNTNGKFTGLTAGTYTVYVKDGNDCTDPTQLKVTITEPDEVDATEVTADHKDVTCYDGNDGAFTASASGGDGNYTYSLKNDFSNSNANGKFTGLTAGTYTVYVKDGNDCTDPTQLKVTITEPDEVDATEVTADHKDVTCYDGKDGAFTASASGGDGNYTYSLKNDFSNSNTNGKFTGLTAGTYTVYVKDGNDCTDPTQLKVTITEPDEVDATEVTADHKDVTCYDGKDGAFTASASGGDGNYTYSLKNDFSNSNANGKFTGLTAGTYTVYVKDGNDCTDPTQLKVTITEPDEVDATEVTADHKDVTCYDGNDGAFTASASGGDGNYTYSLKNDFSNSNANGKFTGLTAGTYTVYVKDGNDCTDPTQLKVTITEPDEVDATEVTADHKDVTCYDGKDGAFTASASGGDGNYTYSLKNDFSNSNANGKFTGLTAGTYTVYVKDGNDCTDPTQLKVTITEPDEVDATEVTADHKDVTCYDGKDGAFTASASGGDGNYTYSLKNDFSNSNANGKFTGLTAGTYTVYVKDGNDCTDPTQLKVTITEPDEVDATEVTADHKDVTCYDGNDGAFTASASGGDGNYTYSLKNDFSNSNANGKFTGLTAGTYTVYVKDGNDCTDPTQLKVTITEPDEVDATEVTADHKDVTCYDGNDGAFTASASGGDGNYTYSLKNDFSNSNANGKFTGLTAGTYTVYVKDGNDCTDPTQLKVTITEPDEVDATEVTADHKDVTCYDGNDGAFTASASGGDGNYTYSLKNDFSNSNANGKFTGLTAGTYTVYVKDGNDCTDPTQLKVTITEPDEVDATEVTADHKDVTCYDGNDGAFTASASGGDGNYTYSLKNDFSNSNANGKFTGLTAGTYTVYVKDGNDCTDPTQLKVTITEPDEVDATEVTADHKDVTCYDGNDGAFTASASGGDGNYTYSLKNDFSNSNTNGKFTGLTAGTYTVYVKDGNDCTDPTQLKVTITEPDEVDATEVTADHKDVTCYDGNDGAFTASASGGDGNYTYSLKNDFSNSNTNGKFTGLTAGTYTVYVKDGNDCTDPTQLKVTITEPDEVDATEVTADHKDVTCYDGKDGAFTASASGGDGNYTYSLKNDFSNSNANGKFTGLTAGTYTVYVKDGNDCTDPTQLKVTITEPDEVDATEVTADHKDVTCYDGKDGAFTASASGGDGNYTYSLKNDFSNSNANGKFTGLTAGTYTVYVKDGNDCTDPTQLKVTITEPDEVDATEVTADHKDVTCYDGNDGAFTASASGGDGNYTYSLKNDFSNSNANGKFTGLTAGTYTVYVKDGNDCTDPTQLKVTITEPDEVDATEVTADHKDVTCYDGNDGAFTASASGGDGNYTYSLKNDFSNSNANGKFTGLTAGTYTVYVKDGNDCTDPTQLKVTITEPDEVDATEVTADHKDVTCYDGKDGAFTASASGGDGNYTYSLKNDFSNSNANGKFTGLTAGTYTVYVKDGNDCTDPTQLKVTITEPDEVDATEVTADHKDVTCYDGNDGAFTASASGGDGNYTYSLKNDFSNSNTNGKFTGLTAGTYTVYVKDGNDCTDPTQLKVTITEPDEVILVAPKDTTVNTCLSQQEVNTEFNIWLSRVIANGGKNLLVTNNNTGAPNACGGSTEVIWTAKSECTEVIKDTAIFTVPDAIKLNVDGPQDFSASSCDFDDQAALDAAFKTWIDSFYVVTNACAATATDISNLTAPDLCEGGTVNVTFGIGNSCTNDTIRATFTINSTTPSFEEDLPANVTVECDMIPSPAALTAVDNCGEVNIVFTETRTDGDCANSYTLTRTWTATDNCGNETSFTQTVVVSDNTAPEVTCNDITVQLDANGSRTITLDDINGGTTDACSDIDTMYISQATFDCDNVGENEVTLTVIDECGNASTCTATVTVEEGDANCGLQPFKANDDILTLVYCPDETVSGDLDLFSNDEGFTPENVTFTILTDLPEGVSVTDGNLLYANENPTEAVITFTYSVCHTVNTENCSTAEVTIQLLVDTDCDDVPDIDDLDDDDDGILDIIEEENALDQTSLDSDGDGIVDRLDIDADNDGIVDNVEWQSTIAEGGEYDYIFPLGTDSNGDGWDDAYDPASNGITYEPWDMDLDGTPDYLDTNTDNEGEDDNVEGWDEFPNDSIADVSYIGSDADKDGLDDAYDTYNTTTEEWAPGQNAIGSDAYLQDTDDDGVRDWRDAVDNRTPPEQFACGDPVIPNAFSPNQDGYNDYFKVMIYCTGTQGGNEERVLGDDFSDARIEIFNRWGTLVYEQERYGDEDYWGDVDAWWDGTSMNNMQVGGNQLPTATYYYILYFNDGKKEPITGFVFLNN